MLAISNLLQLADGYERFALVTDTTLSFRVFGDSKKLAALRSGSDITTGRFNAAIGWFSANWPEGLAWPEGIERPELDETPATGPGEATGAAA